jgi:hypothetical protein
MQGSASWSEIKPGRGRAPAGRQTTANSQRAFHSTEGHRVVKERRNPASRPPGPRVRRCPAVCGSPGRPKARIQTTLPHTELVKIKRFSLNAKIGPFAFAVECPNSAGFLQRFTGVRGIAVPRRLTVGRSRSGRLRDGAPITAGNATVWYDRQELQTLPNRSSAPEPRSRASGKSPVS